MQHRQEIESILEDRKQYDIDFDGIEFGLFHAEHLRIDHNYETSHWAVQSVFDEIKDTIEFYQERKTA